MEEKSPSGSKLDRFVTKYRQDHTHPVNHFLHLGVGWPMVALAVLLLPFRPWWSLALFFLCIYIIHGLFILGEDWASAG